MWVYANTQRSQESVCVERLEIGINELSGESVDQLHPHLHPSFKKTDVITRDKMYEKKKGGQKRKKQNNIQIIVLARQGHPKSINLNYKSARQL